MFLKWPPMSTLASDLFWLVRLNILKYHPIHHFLFPTNFWPFFQFQFSTCIRFPIITIPLLWIMIVCRICLNFVIYIILKKVHFFDLGVTSKKEKSLFKDIIQTGGRVVKAISKCFQKLLSSFGLCLIHFQLRKYQSNST